MKSILVTASGGAIDRAVFATALAVARPLGAHLEFFHLRLSLGEAARRTPHVAFARGAGLRHALRELRAEDEARSFAARRGFEAFCSQGGIRLAAAPGRHDDVTASLCEESGEAEGRLARAGRHNDLIVLGRHTRADGFPADFIDRILLQCGRPILIAPAAAPGTLSGTVMVAWKETPEAARALAAALPLLAKADRVVIANIREADNEAADPLDDVARHLAWHGVDADVCSIAAGGHPPAECLAAAARECRADLLVMGAYGHSRTHQLLFGSCTQYFLENAARAVLFMH